jgi:hypothetical protein
VSVYVFGYASLVALQEPLAAGAERAALLGRLRGYRRFWGAAMNNWEGGEDAKHWLDGDTGERPRIRVAYLDIEPRQGRTVNGAAIHVDGARLAALDAREINYQRIDVSAAFEPELPGTVYAYVGLDAARERCRRGAAEGNVFVSAQYLAMVQSGFERIDRGMSEFDRTTGACPFPERDLQVALPSGDV